MFLPSDHDVEERLRALNPALWNALYPRAYVAQGNYASPKQAAASMMLNILGQVMSPEADMPIGVET